MHNLLNYMSKERAREREIEAGAPSGGVLFHDSGD